MNASLRYWPTLLAALITGVAVAMSGFGRNPEGRHQVADLDGTNSKHRSGMQSGEQGSRRFGRPEKSAPAAAFAAAWKILGEGRFAPHEISDLQCELLGEWCLVDLEAALGAGFNEAHGERGFSGLSTVEVCRAGITARPDLAWELIRNRTFGLSTARLRPVWTEIMGWQDPVELLGLFDELPADPPWSKGWLGTASSGDPDPFATGPDAGVTRDLGPQRTVRGTMPGSREEAICAALRGAHRIGTSRAVSTEVVDRVIALAGEDSSGRLLTTAESYMSRKQTEETLVAGIYGAHRPEVRRFYLVAYANKLLDPDDPAREVEPSRVPDDLRYEIMEILKSDGGR
ncbi:hypothetical protein [Luteolibacter marinus]|uniref:hypothetical protein n=1 Tax=Luteolibacter marinus TaxID=2776705 RepID=UPI0018661AF3|nr:hypothetical protein [Luteolibacter marinus]